MDVYAVLIALVVALMSGGLAATSEKDDKQKTINYGSFVTVFVAVFVVVYALYVMSTDSNDNAGMFENVKTGDPPF